MSPPFNPITAYLEANDASLLSLAKRTGLHYDTLAKAAKGITVPAFSTILKLYRHAGISMLAWEETPPVKAQMARFVDPDIYAAKQRRYRESHERA